MKLEKIFEQLSRGEIDIVSAMAMAGAEKNISDIGFARIDHSRGLRCGFPEFIFGEGKSFEQIQAIVKEILKKKHAVLATRLDSTSGEKLKKSFPGSEYDETARLFFIDPAMKKSGKNKKRGKVLVITAGTSDLPVALEAKHTASLCGCNAELMPDAGVAGIHRLFAQSVKLKSADVIIAVAGMEGALPSVIGGLVSCPVIAVPTSIGYGASLKGFAAMFSMLNSCANGITVVNIDNGFGAGCAASRIIRLKYDLAK